MTSPSPAYIDQQFQTIDRQPSNLDHCNRRGAPRSAHGPDWTCPARPARVTAGGVIAQVFAHANQAMQNAAAAGILAGVASLVAAVVMVVRSR
jgi:hypothetical protein